MRLSELQIEKASLYLLDISKLMFGATVVPLFVPKSDFSVGFFVSGLGVSVLCLVFGLLMLKQIHE